MIGFSAPWLLLGLPLAAVPLLLHLVHRHEPPEVAFPAVRYLDDATRDHRRRLHLRHLLLLIVRTLLILALVFAAAGMRCAGIGLGGHAASAVVLVVDNSASSGVIVDGVPRLSALVGAAGRVLDEATSADQLWLRTADGPAVPGTRAQLRQRLAVLAPTTSRLDLGTAVTEGRTLVAQANRPGAVVVLSDMQRSALSASVGDADVLVIRPTDAVPQNRGIAELTVGSGPWGVDGGLVTLSLQSTDTVPVPAAVGFEGAPLRDVLLVPGVPTAVRLAVVPRGWSMLRAVLPPDEFRADDERAVAMYAAPPPSVRWDPSERFLNAALAVLVADGRAMPGEGVRVGDLGSGASVVVPPADPALLGALNRRLAARGVGWQYEGTVRGEEQSDSAAFLPDPVEVHSRVRLEPSRGGGEVLATVAREPWVVRSGDVILVGSRFEPAWSGLPLETGFVPLLDALIRQAFRGEVTLPDGIAGMPIRLPDPLSAVAYAGQRQPVEGGSLWVPKSTGVYHLLVGEDTLGAVTVLLDPRESDLTRAEDDAVRTLWGRTTVAGFEEGPRRAFLAGGRGDLRGPLLVLALLCVFAEAGLSGRVGQRN